MYGYTRPPPAFDPKGKFHALKDIPTLNGTDYREGETVDMSRCSAREVESLWRNRWIEGGEGKPRVRKTAPVPAPAGKAKS